MFVVLTFSRLFQFICVTLWYILMWIKNSFTLIKNIYFMNIKIPRTIVSLIWIWSSSLHWCPYLFTWDICHISKSVGALHFPWFRRDINPTKFESRLTIFEVSCTGPTGLPSYDFLVHTCFETKLCQTSVDYIFLINPRKCAFHFGRCMKYCCYNCDIFSSIFFGVGNGLSFKFIHRDNKGGLLIYI